MILRLSQKVAKKVKTVPTRVLPLDENPFADWSVHAFTADRSHYLILTNTASLYSTVLHGAGITSDQLLLDRGLSAIREVMIDDGLEFTYRRFIAPSSAEIEFSKALNRSVTGSMNDLVYHAKFWLTERGLAPHDTSVELNDMPMSALNYAVPREAFRSLNVAQRAAE